MVESIFMAQNIAGMLLIIASITIIIFVMGLESESRKDEKGKHKVYACGENIPLKKLTVPQMNFYAGIIKTLKLDALREMHSGKLTTYLFWSFGGLIILLTILKVFA